MSASSQAARAKVCLEISCLIKAPWRLLSSGGACKHTPGTQPPPVSLLSIPCSPYFFSFCPLLDSISQDKWTNAKNSRLIVSISSLSASNSSVYTRFSKLLHLSLFILLFLFRFLFLSLLSKFTSFFIDKEMKLNNLVYIYI